MYPNTHNLINKNIQINNNNIISRTVMQFTSILSKNSEYMNLSDLD